MGCILLLGDDHQIASNGLALSGPTAALFEVFLVQLDFAGGDDLADRFRPLLATTTVAPSTGPTAAALTVPVAALVPLTVLAVTAALILP
ncbi:MAG: hypothetical protein AAGA65_25120, partial [Actinomycetota bacterium]